MDTAASRSQIIVSYIKPSRKPMIEAQAQFTSPPNTLYEVVQAQTLQPAFYGMPFKKKNYLTIEFHVKFHLKNRYRTNRSFSRKS